MQENKVNEQEFAIFTNIVILCPNYRAFGKMMATLASDTHSLASASLPISDLCDECLK